MELFLKVVLYCAATPWVLPCPPNGTPIHPPPTLPQWIVPLVLTIGTQYNHAKWREPDDGKWNSPLFLKVGLPGPCPIAWGQSILL